VGSEVAAVSSEEAAAPRIQVVAWVALVASNRRTLWAEASHRMLRPLVVDLAEVGRPHSLQELLKILHLRVWEVDSVVVARLALANPVDNHQLASAELAIRPQALEASEDSSRAHPPGLVASVETNRAVFLARTPRVQPAFHRAALRKALELQEGVDQASDNRTPARASSGKTIKANLATRTTPLVQVDLVVQVQLETNSTHRAKLSPQGAAKSCFSNN